jgi:hypothetical protein
VVNYYSNITVSNYCNISTDISRWHGFIWDTSIHKYTVTVNASFIKDTLIGFAPSKLFDVDAAQYCPCGWYLTFFYGHIILQLVTIVKNIPADVDWEILSLAYIIALPGRFPSRRMVCLLEWLLLMLMERI